MAKIDTNPICKTYTEVAAVATRTAVFDDDYNFRPVTRVDRVKGVSYQEAFVGDYRITATYVRGKVGRVTCESLTPFGWDKAHIPARVILDAQDEAAREWFNLPIQEVNGKCLPSPYGWDGTRTISEWYIKFMTMRLLKAAPLSLMQDLADECSFSPAEGFDPTPLPMLKSFTLPPMPKGAEYMWYVTTRDQKIHICQRYTDALVSPNVTQIVLVVKNAYKTKLTQYGTRWYFYARM